MAAKHHPDLIMCRKQPGIGASRFHAGARPALAAACRPPTHPAAHTHIHTRGSAPPGGARALRRSQRLCARPLCRASAPTLSPRPSSSAPLLSPRQPSGACATSTTASASSATRTCGRRRSSRSATSATLARTTAAASSAARPARRRPTTARSARSRRRTCVGARVRCRCAAAAAAAAAIHPLPPASPRSPPILQRDGCPKVINLGAARTNLYYNAKKFGFAKAQ